MPRLYRSPKDDELISIPVRVRLSPENWKRVKELAGMGNIFDYEFITLAVEFALSHVSVRQPKKLMEWYFGEESSTEDKIIPPGADEPEPEEEATP